ncbi:hypothetical protein I6A60_00500 [Frankia sp. AgB1.9]|uniref:hypothetical protein n=1 Tax=unclassified Frankia TaxID=2632575 RepID=UPI0019327F94|nr:MULTISPECIES: hypothetical protein [unclassified Frankia]MBL7487360.1 hypothetical protein [Frankia sp. AgW1.1]MBL7546368.1 hypothetical protein [Frankia sp. AgB1.9]MBL7618587.1 hypothetical protein [Frankia sp. AgB1.8]
MTAAERAAAKRRAAHKRREAVLIARSRAAKDSPTKQISAAADFLRAVLAQLPRAQAEAAAKEAIAFVQDLLDRIDSEFP